MLNEDNQIGVVLFSSVKPEQVPIVMNKMMTEMDKEFPHNEVNCRRLPHRHTYFANGLRVLRSSCSI